jgi:ParB-like chromosome segregation protein Spo0J
VRTFFPILEDDALDKLAADIKEHGLREPVRLWRDRQNGRLYVLDGRNRLEALERAGVEILNNPMDAEEHPCFVITEEDNPASILISLNIHRRHLTKPAGGADYCSG